MTRCTSNSRLKGTTIELGGMRIAHGTLAGSKPGENQDAVLAAPLPETGEGSGVVCAIADGVGQTRLAATAARSAVDTVVAYIVASAGPLTTTLPLAAAAAHEAVRRSTADASGNVDGASTLVVAVVSGDQLYVMSAGDSRAYFVAVGGQIDQITTDHSWVQEQIAAGVLDAEAAAVHPWRSVITRYLGGPQPPEADVFQRTLTPGSGVLLCSDGLTAAISEAEVAEVLALGDPQAAADTLIELARQRNARDDVTLCVISTACFSEDAG